jgi:hypothetical protein
MSAQITPGNAISKLVEDFCGLYGVPFYRMQSRMFNVIGAGGKERPMFMGTWQNDRGEKFKGGMPDYLLTPPLPIRQVVQRLGGIVDVETRMNTMVPLWVEVKAGADRLSPVQKEFRDYQERIGGFWLMVRDGSELEGWFKEHGVKR